jgi:hypothetical protein
MFPSAVKIANAAFGAFDSPMDTPAAPSTSCYSGSSHTHSYASRSIKPKTARVKCLTDSKYDGDSAPTEGWSHGGQNCLHDMRIVGNA